MARTKPAGRARSGKPIRPSETRPTGVPVTALVTLFVLGFALAFLIGSWTSGPSTTEQRIAELQQAEAQRDVEQIGSLIDLARGGRERLTPVLTAMAKAAPLTSTTPATLPTAEEVSGWRSVVSSEAQRYAENPSAGNGVNVARNGLRTAVQQFAAAVDGFDAAVTTASPMRDKLLTLAGTQRTLALRTWSVAALQLDVISIGAGKGHVHVQLPSGADAGAIPADTAPEGIGPR